MGGSDDQREKMQVALQCIASIGGLFSGLFIGLLGTQTQDMWMLVPGYIAVVGVVAVGACLVIGLFSERLLQPVAGLLCMDVYTGMGNGFLLLAIHEQRSLVIPDAAAFNLGLNLFTIAAFTLHAYGHRRIGMLLVLLFALMSTALYFGLPAGW